MAVALPAKPDVTPPVERDLTGSEFLQHVLGPEATDEDITTVGRAWNVAQAEINSILSTPPKNDDDHLNQEIRIAITAAQAEAAINKLGRITTGAIQTATPEQLITWSETYEQNLRGNYQEQLEVRKKLARLAGTDQQDTREHLELQAELLELREVFDRQAGYLWECNEQSGLNKVLAI